ncbi:probable Major spike protein G [Zygosaccharomyces bailii ISA1307]|nr:probable Major spike protein G [Zygosaccharomyces bailii ISA1307]
MFQTFISRHNSNFFSDKLVLTSVTPASSAPVLQTPKATSSTLYFDSLTVNAGNGGFLHCIQMDTSVNAANQVVSVGADIAFDADPKFFACLVRFESSSVPTTLPTAYDVYPLDGRHDGGYYTVKDCVTIDVLPRTPGNNVFLHCIQMDTSVNAANQVVSVGADIAFDADPKFFACLVRFESSSVPTTLPTAYDVYPLDGRHDGGYYTVKDCVTIDVLPRTPGNNVYVGFMVWSNFTATKCRGLVSLNQVIKEIICLQPLK